MSESRSRKRSKGELGNISFDSAAPKGHIIPDTNDAYDIGSAS